MSVKGIKRSDLPLMVREMVAEMQKRQTKRKIDKEKQKRAFDGGRNAKKEKRKKKQKRKTGSCCCCFCS